MKRLILFILFSLFLLLTPSKIFAQNSWVIESFDTQISVDKSGEIIFSENIEVDFRTLEKHGIYRNIPYLYNDGGQDIYTEVVIGDVLQDGNTATTKIERNNANIQVRIGDADKTISGKHSYQINYSVKGVLQGFENYDELFWNVTGNEWDVQILSSSANISTPQDAILETKCYQGHFGSRESCESMVTSPTNSSFNTTRILNPGEGFSIVTAFEKDVFPIISLERPPTFFEKLLSPISIITFFASLIVGIGAIFIIWLKFGRDYWFPGMSGYKNKAIGKILKPIGARESVVVEYTPPENLTPAIVGVIVDEKANTLDVTSTIIDLAGRGHLEIEEISKKWFFGKKDYILKKKSKDTKSLLRYEQELLNRLFENKSQQKVSELKTKFYKDLAKVKKKLYEEVVNKGFFDKNPEKTRGKYLGIGIGVLILSVLLTVVSMINEIVISTDIGLAGIASGVVFLIFSQFMSRRTAQGREMYRRIKGYRLFIETAEKHRQKFFEDKNMFNKILPYAIVFGLTDKFAKAMRNMGLKPNNPTWYHGAHAFNAASFSSDLSDFSTSLSSAIASSPSSSGFSSGGGFSGGGFGGGGGGSW